MFTKSHDVCVWRGGREGGPSPLPGPSPSICSDCGAHWCWDQPISASASPAASNLIIRSSGGPALTGAQHLHSEPSDPAASCPAHRPPGPLASVSPHSGRFLHLSIGWLSMVTQVPLRSAGQFSTLPSLLFQL